MAIRLKLSETERVLFCASKWWGDPDLPGDMEYPTMKVTEEGESYDYPLTFICQINCEDLIPFDKEGILPHEGMLYFFGAVDELLGYESPTPTCFGEWPKGHILVKYTKSINFETFQSCMIVDDEGKSLSDSELEISFSECNEDASGLKMLGTGLDDDFVNLLQIEDAADAGFKDENWKALNVMIKKSDLKFGNWKKAKASLR